MISAYLVSQHLLPTSNSSYLEESCVSRWINGYITFWHPAAITHFEKPPVIENSELQTSKEGVYCLTEEKLDSTQKDFRSFLANEDIEISQQNLLRLLEVSPEGISECEPNLIDHFRSLGFSYLILNGLFEAMNHENLISHESFWEECQLAAKDWVAKNHESSLEHLKSAAALLQSAREVLHSSNVYLLNLVELETESTDFRADYYACPINLLASTRELKKLRPEILEQISTLAKSESIEIAGAISEDIASPLMPLSSRIFNLQSGCGQFNELVGINPKVFLQKNPTIASDMPRLLHLANIQKAILLPFKTNTVPAFRGPVVSWSSHVGRQVEAFCREPIAGNLYHSMFHLAYHLGKCIQQDSSPTIAFYSKSNQQNKVFELFQKSSILAPIFGNWHILSTYLHDVYPNEYPGPISQEDFNHPFLELNAENANPISSRQNCLNRLKEIDSASTMISLGISLGGSTQLDAEKLLPQVNALLEQNNSNEAPVNEGEELFAQSGKILSQRLLSRGTENTPGYLFINPCSFARRIGQINQIGQGISQGKGVLASHDGEALVEVPGMGFTWVPEATPENPAKFENRFKLADETTVRNEFFEIEFDQNSGAIRAFRDLKARLNRLNVLLVSSLGSSMISTGKNVISSGPLQGILEYSGFIQGSAQEKLAEYTLRVTTWIGRPIVDLEIKISPTKPMGKDRHHDYFAARIAWPKDLVRLLRGTQGKTENPSNPHIQGADFLEWKWGTKRTFLFPRSLPYIEKNGENYLDLILLTDGENQKVYKISLSMDREHPFQISTALDAPIFIQKVDKGPPPSGPTGWLFHIDAPNLVMHKIMPGKEPGSVIFLLEETEGFATPCEIKCLRPPQRACLVDLNGNDQGELVIKEETINLYPESHGIMLVKVFF